MSTLLRTVERLIDDDWYMCQMSELNKDDVFRLQEPTGQFVGSCNFVATDNPHLDPNSNIWGIMASHLPNGEKQ